MRTSISYVKTQFHYIFRYSYYLLHYTKQILDHCSYQVGICSIIIVRCLVSRDEQQKTFKFKCICGQGELHIPCVEYYELCMPCGSNFLMKTEEICPIVIHCYFRANKVI